MPAKSRAAASSAGGPETANRTTRETILQAASQLFANQGFAATSTRVIAAQVGITQPTLYFHFDSKDAIFRALVRAILDPWVRLAEEIGNGSEPAEVKLYRLFHRISLDLATYPYDPNPFMTDRAWLRPQQAELLQDMCAVLDVAESLIAEGVERGTFHEVEPPPAMSAVAFFAVSAESYRGADPARSAASMVNLLMRGLLREPERVDWIQARALARDSLARHDSREPA